MVQRQLPMFPNGSTAITRDLAVEKRDGVITYFYGTLPVFTHDENDDASFKIITAQFYTIGYVKPIKGVRVNDFSYHLAISSKKELSITLTP